MSESGRPLVEILYFDDCPNYEPANALVSKVARELSLVPELRLIRVADQRDAERLRFLGSPTILVDGVDTDPHAPNHKQYALCCRVFATAHGPAGQPEERWVRDALLAAAAPDRDPVASALQAAAIPNARRGSARAARLNHAEREFYRWILDRFAEGAPPKREQLEQRARTLGTKRRHDNARTRRPRPRGRRRCGACCLPVKGSNIGFTRLVGSRDGSTPRRRACSPA